MECPELDKILTFLRKIKFERYDGTDLVSKAVDSFWQNTRVKEKIDFDSDFSFLLLDKRLLQGEVNHLDYEGKVQCYDPTVHYANVHPRGDDILTWLKDRFSEDNGFEFPKPIHMHNFDVWLAVLRAVQFTSRTMGIQFAKKLQLIDYAAALTEAKELCKVESGNSEPGEKKILASILCKFCENSDTSKVFLWAIRDVMNGETCPKFDSPDSLRIICEQRDKVNDTTVMESIEDLESVVKEKVALIDSKIMLTENSRISLLSDLTRLGLFDYRSYIHPPLKKYLLEEVILRIPRK